jgi:DNA-binding YbaB/EbfC family protein
MDLSNLMQIAGQMRAQLTRVQEESGHKRYTGEAGAGLVRVVMTGRYEAVEVHIDPKALEPGDLSLVEDLVRAAVSQATRSVTDGHKNDLTEIARQLGIDASLLGAGGT